MKKLLSTVTSLTLIFGMIFPASLSASTVEGQAPVLDGEVTAEIQETAPLTDDELIDLFNITSNDGSSVEIIQNTVNYAKPGTYQIGFEATNSYGSDYYPTFLTITDKPVTLTTETTTQTIMEDQTNVDYVSLFGAEATDVTKGDLTSQITVDDSDVILSQAGTYDLTFNISDDEGSTATQTVSLEVLNGKPVIEGSYSETITSGDVQTDQDLIELFGITSSESEIKVDTTKYGVVDYSTPGTYQIEFSVTNSYGTSVHPAVLYIV